MTEQSSLTHSVHPEANTGVHAVQGPVGSYVNYCESAGMFLSVRLFRLSCLSLCVCLCVCVFLYSPRLCSSVCMSVLGSNSVSVSPSLSGSSAAGGDGFCGWLTDSTWIFVPRSGVSEARKAAGPSIPAE